MINKLLVKLEGSGHIKATFRLPKTLLKQLKFYATDRDMTVTDVVIKACEEFLSRDKAFKEKFKPTGL